MPPPVLYNQGDELHGASEYPAPLRHLFPSAPRKGRCHTSILTPCVEADEAPNTLVTAIKEIKVETRISKLAVTILARHSPTECMSAYPTLFGALDAFVSVHSSRPD